MTTELLVSHPSIPFVVGALLMWFVRTVRLRQAVLVAVPLVALMQLSHLPDTAGTFTYLGLALQPLRVDSLSFLFLHVFCIMALIGFVYSLHVLNPGTHGAALLYVAGSLGVTLSGDYVTLFVFWELMAVASTFLIWLQPTRTARDAGLRYFLVHSAGGLALLCGIILRYLETGDLAVVQVVPATAGLADYLIMAGFMLNAAVPPLHAWLADAYPEATITGAVFLCAFTTKTAVYALCRVFPGFDVLAVWGACMALYGVCYAIVENNSRRILSYHIISQVGYMVCGIGIGTDLGVSGACAHAYAHIIYKALLFMGVGCVLEMTGRQKLTELGGLYRSMPWALVFTVIGGISISGFPLTSGFVSKSMVTAAAAEAHCSGILLLLMLASVGTFLSVGIKLPYCIWFREPVEKAPLQTRQAPWNMYLAMAIAGFFCFFIGCSPDWLYRLLPRHAAYHPYTASHVSETLQLLGFTGLGFYLLARKLAPHDTLQLDLDWVYRRAAAVLQHWCRARAQQYDEKLGELYATRGLHHFMGVARRCATYDIERIDRFVDGIAQQVAGCGERIRNFHNGKIQHYIGAAMMLLFLVLGIIVYF